MGGRGLQLQYQHTDQHTCVLGRNGSGLLAIALPPLLVACKTGHSLACGLDVGLLDNRLSPLIIGIVGARDLAGHASVFPLPAS